MSRAGRRKQQVLRYVRETIASDGIAPSYGMICSELGIATRTHVHRIVKRLEHDGMLSRAGSGRVRRIRLAAHA